MSDRRSPVTLDAFIARIERERPKTVTFADLKQVSPKPWVLRAGNGKTARIRMLVGDVRYERQQGEDIWHLAGSSSDLDLEDVA